mmetsp:Transcript_17376/g.29138  ORF Transcript_17376/g.29138 Transcript_17376/m.29138 type:complete len:122 (+) Transcript_17376:315-680(+)
MGPSYHSSSQNAKKTSRLFQPSSLLPLALSLLALGLLVSVPVVQLMPLLGVTFPSEDAFAVEILQIRFLSWEYLHCFPQRLILLAGQFVGGDARSQPAGLQVPLIVTQSVVWLMQLLSTEL